MKQDLGTQRPIDTDTGEVSRRKWTAHGDNLLIARGSGLTMGSLHLQRENNQFVFKCSVHSHPPVLQMVVFKSCSAVGSLAGPANPSPPPGDRALCT